MYKSHIIILFSFFFLALSSCQKNVSINPIAPVKNPISIETRDTSLEISCIDSSGMMSEIQNISNTTRQLTISINSDCVKKKIPATIWKELILKKISYVLFYTNDYILSKDELTEIAAFQSKTIANVIPQTREEGKILRNGKPRKLYEPVGANTIYSQEEVDKCNGLYGGVSPIIKSSEDEEKTRQNVVNCYLSLPDVP